jgi:cell division septum initiation protein DivIVA
MSARKQEQERRPPAAAADAAARLAAIVEAAERAAAKVIDDAEQQAQDLIEEARERADRLVAERLRELADELDPGAPVEAPRLRPVEGSAGEEDEVADEPPAARRSGSAGARLLATQMAVSGADREEIEQRLRGGFGIEDPGAILDAILGPEG